MVALTASVIASPCLPQTEPPLPAPPTDWRSTLLRNHPLVGAIWNARESRAATVEELGPALATARYVLLGEVHDNPDHHRLQAWEVTAATRGITARSRESLAHVVKTLLAMEMLSRDQGHQIGMFLGAETGPFTPERFALAVQWHKSGWPSFDIYAPILDAAFQRQMPPAPASPSRERIKAVSKSGLLVALGDAEVTELGLDRPLFQSLASALSAELKDSHCGMLPDEAPPRMSDVQRFRDATMADSLFSGGDGKGAILIAGNGHVRRDRGVPLYLERRGVKPDEILSVMHIEVEDGKTDPAAYAPRAPDGTPAVDFIWFTPRQERPDPCEGLRDRLAKPAAAAK